MPRYILALALTIATPLGAAEPPPQTCFPNIATALSAAKVWGENSWFGGYTQDGGGIILTLSPEAVWSLFQVAPDQSVCLALDGISFKQLNPIGGAQ